MSIFLKTEDEIELMREANLLVGKTLALMAKNIKPGVTTLQLDKLAEEFIRDNGAIPTFKGFPNPYGGPFPASICTSVNEIVVHGVPDDKTVLKDGDIISIDCGTILNGYNGDSCYTFCVGEVSDEVKKLLRTTKESLYKGIEAAVAGNHIGDIGFAVQDYCESQGYGVVRELTGHGIGTILFTACFRLLMKFPLKQEFVRNARYRHLLFHLSRPLLLARYQQRLLVYLYEYYSNYYNNA